MFWDDNTSISPKRLISIARVGLYIVGCFLSASPLAWAQGSIALEHLSIADGLPSQSIYAIAQDEKGFIWLGSESGLSRYDGYEIRNFVRHPFSPGKGPGGNYIQAIFPQDEENLWLGTVGAGANLFNQATETFSNFLHDPNDPYSLSNNFIRTIISDQRKNIWLGTDNGLNIFHPDEGRFYRFFTEQGSNPLGIDHRIGPLFQDRRHNIWMGTGNGQLVFLEQGRVDSPQIIDWGQDRSPQTIFAITGLDTDVVLVSTDQGLFRFEPGPGHGSFDKKRDASIPPDYVISLVLQDKNGLLWATDSYKGLISLDPATSEIRYGAKLFRNNPLTGIPIDPILGLALFEDRSGTIWFAQRGVYMKKKRKFGPYMPTPSALRSFWQDESGAVFVGLSSRGLMKEMRVDGEVILKEIKIGAFDNLHVSSIHKDTAGYFWLGTSAQGLLKIRLNQRDEVIYLRQFLPDPADPFSLTSPRIVNMYADRSNRLWIGTIDGFCILDLKEKDPAHFIRFPYTESNTFGLINPTVRSFLEDSRGQMWIGTRGGLNRFRPQNKIDPSNVKMDQFVYSVSDTSGIGSNDVLTLHETEDGFIWMATGDGGLNGFDPATQTFTHYTTEDGLPDNLVYTVVGDDRKRLWMSTNQGISVFDRQTGRFTNFGPEDGLQGYEYVGLAGYKTRDGEIFIGGTNGYDRFYPEKIFTPIDSVAPSIAITNLFLTNHKVTVGVETDGFRLDRQITYLDRLTLPYRHNSFTLEFAALDFQAPTRNEYAYRLAPYDKGWTRTGAGNRRATYTKVPPGKYRFTVKAANAEGIRNEEGASLDVIITAPWYWSWWSKVLYLFLVLSGTASLYRFQLKRRLQRAEVLRLQELDAVKTRLYTNITHEFRTPITVILGMAEQVRDQPQHWFREGIEMIIRNGRYLLNLVNHMLDLSKLESGAMRVNLVQDDVINYLKYIAGSFYSQAQTRDIRLRFLSQEKELLADYDPEKLMHIVSNLLSNAVKYTPDGGEIYLSVKVGDECFPSPGLPANFQIEVRDTGIGIPPDKLPYVFDRYYQVDDSATRRAEGTGIGLTLVKELVKLLEGSVAVESQVGIGTTFTVTLPWTRKAERAAEKSAELLQKQLDTHTLALARADNSGSLVSGADEQPLLLIVEDNEDVIRYLQTVLGATYRVIGARDGQDGIDKAFEWVPDVIISDVMMPVKDGFELCDTLKKDIRTSHIPIVLLTAKADISSKIEGLEWGADAYLTKPFNREELLVILRKAIELRRELQRRYSNPGPFPVSPHRKVQQEDAFLQRIRQLLEENLQDEEFGLDHLCQSLHLSRTQVYRKVKALTGESVGHYMQLMRLHKAKELLDTTDLNVSDVAYEVGFKDPGYFSRSFTRVFGAPPSAFRKK